MERLSASGAVTQLDPHPRRSVELHRQAGERFGLDLPHALAGQTEQTEGGWSLGELVRDENAKCPADVLLDEDTLRHVMRRIEGLEERAATIIRLRFGLGGAEPMTLKEIGAVLGLTRERVRQIESETLANLAMAIDGVPRATIRLRQGA